MSKIIYNTITEGFAKIKVPLTNKVSSKMPVFYNPAMRINRDITILFLSVIKSSCMRIALPLEATGIMGIRILLELPKEKIAHIELNDIRKSAFELIKCNLRINKLRDNKISISNKEANIFLLSSSGFDYIDIDPFGSPNNFLDSGIKCLKDNGYLAVTCTDTSGLSGTYPNACLRKYWAIPQKGSNMHEIGLRILIRKIQLVGAQYNKALTPVFSYSHAHYFRVYLRCNVSKKATEEALAQHKLFQGAGPLWIGSLWDTVIVKEMLKSANEFSFKILNIIKDESELNIVGFFDVHEICERYKIPKIPRSQDLIYKIKLKGYNAVRTHFTPTGIRTDIGIKQFVKLVSNFVGDYKFLD